MARHDGTTKAVEIGQPGAEDEAQLLRKEITIQRVAELEVCWHSGN